MVLFCDVRKIMIERIERGCRREQADVDQARNFERVSGWGKDVVMFKPRLGASDRFGLEKIFSKKLFA